jgi:hypothetical protein
MYLKKNHIKRVLKSLLLKIRSKGRIKLQQTSYIFVFLIHMIHEREVMLLKHSPQTLISNFQSSEAVTTPAHF